MASIDAPFSAPLPVPRLGHAERNFYLSLLSMAAIDLLLSGLFLALSGKLWIIVFRLPEILFFLVGINLAGGYWLFRPIRHFLQTGSGRDAATARAARLGKMTTVWVIVVSTLFTCSSFFITPFVVFDIPFTTEIMYILVGRALAWVVLLPYVAVFVLQEYLRNLRRTLFDEHGIVVPPGRSLLGRKLALVFIGGAVVPAASIAITLLLVPEISPITGQPRSVVIITSITGATIALLLAFWATQRSTSAGFRSILSGMQRIERGEFGGRIVIETDDELGRLSEGFNALSRQLERSKAETESKEAERAQAARQFHEAQKRDALGRLAAGIAHDFNNILAIIVMYSDTVRTRLPEDDRNRARLDEVLTAAGRGKELISQILDFTRDKAKEHAEFDLADNIRETITLIEETVGRSVEISLEAPEGGVIVKGDGIGLHQVVANLAINAVHAMPDGKGRLEISLRTVSLASERAESFRRRFVGAGQDVIYETDADGDARAWLGHLPPGDYARIAVADNGSGMSMETLQKVFDPYFTTKPVGEGTGLGLAAVAGIAAAHDGGVAVRTAAGKGTTFCVFLPLPDREEIEENG